MGGAAIARCLRRQSRPAPASVPSAALVALFDMAGEHVGALTHFQPHRATLRGILNDDGSLLPGRDPHLEPIGSRTFDRFAVDPHYALTVTAPHHAGDTYVANRRPVGFSAA